MTKTKGEARKIQVLVTVPRVEGMSEAGHRKAVRDAVAASGDFYGRAVKVAPAAASPLVALQVRAMQ